MGTESQHLFGNMARDGEEGKYEKKGENKNDMHESISAPQRSNMLVHIQQAVTTTDGQTK